MAAERISGKWVYLLGVLFSALATILTPLATELGVAAFIVLRALQGFGQVRSEAILDVNANKSTFSQ